MVIITKLFFAVHGNADCLPRLPLETDPTFEKYQSLHPVVNLIQQNLLTQLPVSADEVKKATEKDPVLKQVLARIKDGWPKTRKNFPPELHPFFNRRFQLTVQDVSFVASRSLFRQL